LKVNVVWSFLVARPRQLAAGSNELPRAGDVAFPEHKVLGSTPGAALTPVHACVVLAGRLGRVGAVRPILVHVTAHTLLGTLHVLTALLEAHQTVSLSRTVAVRVVLLVDVVRSTHAVCNLFTDSLLTVVTLTDTVETVLRDGIY